MALDIKDRAGCITKAEMRTYFERAITDTPALRANTPLAAMTVNGEFSHYTEPDTDTMWLGFAIGMRCMERVEAAKAVQAAAVPAANPLADWTFSRGEDGRIVVGSPVYGPGVLATWAARSGGNLAERVLHALADALLDAGVTSDVYPNPAPALTKANTGWLREGGLLYRLTEGKRPENRDEINVTMADGSRSPEARARRAGELLDLINGAAGAAANKDSDE